MQRAIGHEKVCRQDQYCFSSDMTNAAQSLQKFPLEGDSSNDCTMKIYHHFHVHLIPRKKSFRAYRKLFLTFLQLPEKPSASKWEGKYVREIMYSRICTWN